MTEKKTPRKWPWMKVLLVLSLSMNLTVVGLVVGAKMSGYGDRRAHFAGASGLRVFMRALPDDQRREVRRYFRLNRPKIYANGKAMHETMQSIHMAIIARPFNADAVRAAFSAQRLHITKSTQDAQKAFVAIISGMTDDQRLRYVNAMKEQRRKWRKTQPGKHRE
ncbi:MAG: periplasmic heavy metal sensor [Amylibacter sp.]|nr:periplasmic heavy metal sensor [Amylibacter sp.]